jgi:hypothetical protein
MNRTSTPTSALSGRDRRGDGGVESATGVFG